MLLIKFTHESTPSLLNFSDNSYASAKSLLCVVFKCIKFAKIYIFIYLHIYILHIYIFAKI